jgi:hypothetical protein
MGSYLFELVDELVSWHGYVWRQSSRLESYILDFHRYCLVSIPEQKRWRRQDRKKK